jgi:hypothetical protein
MLEKILKQELNKKYKKQIAEAKDDPIGLVNTEKILKDDKKENDAYQKEVGKKMDDYVKDMGNTDFVPPKHNLTDRQDEYIATHRGGNNMQLEYGQEPSEAFKERLAKNVPYGNLKDKANIYDNIGVTKFKANDTQAKMEKAAKEIEKQKGDIDGYYDETGKNIKYADQPVTKDNKKATGKNNLSRLAFNENKMKKIKYKKEFIDESHAISIIPKSYKVDNHIFEMTDGNFTFKVKWEGGKDGEGYIINSKNTKILSEEMGRMKDLFNYDSSETFDRKKTITMDEQQYFLGMFNDMNGFKLLDTDVEEPIIDDLNDEEVEETTEEVVAEGKEIDEDCELEEGCGEIDEDKSQSKIDKDIKKAKNPGDGAEDESYKGKKFKKSVIGVYDDNIKGPFQKEDTEGDETDHYGEDEGKDHKEEMSMEDHVAAIEDHLHALKKDMGYDEDHEDRDEEGTDFREGLVEDSEAEETRNYGDDEGEDRKEEEELEDEERMAPEDHIAAIEGHLDALKKDMGYDEDREDRDEPGTDFREETLKEWCKKNDLLSESGNVSMVCIEKAKLSENIAISKKSLIAEKIITKKSKWIGQNILKEEKKDDKESGGPKAPKGKGCAESKGGSGCIKKGKYTDKSGKKYSWYIINNKKGGVFKGCSSKKDCKEILEVPAVHKG